MAAKTPFLPALGTAAAFQWEMVPRRASPSVMLLTTEMRSASASCSSVRPITLPAPRGVETAA